MRFGILGPVLVHDGYAAIGIPAPRQRTLLAALLVQVGQAVPADKLAETIWDGAPPTGAATTLRTHVMRMRRVLGPHAAARVHTRSGSYLLEAGADEVDILQFTALCKQGSAAAEAGGWRQADRVLSDALELWRGVPLADITSETLRADVMPYLEQMHLQALECRNDAWLSLGRHSELVPQLQVLVAGNPLRERFHAQLMLALYRSGRQADALAEFQRARLHIVEELGIEPGPELRELHQRVLAADASLTVRRTAAAAGPRPDHVPRQLPAAVMNFIGRQREMSAMTAALERADGQSAQQALVISAISGTAGVGKTALAVQWAHDAADRYPDGQLYVNLRGYDPGPPVLPADALAGFLHALGLAGEEIPPGLDDRAATYRSAISGRRMLVVLDNAGEAEQLRPLLPGTSSCVTVVTSRDALTGLVARDGAWRLDLDVLPHADAVSLLRVLIGSRVDAEPAAAAALAACCCRLPLALRIAAEMAACRADTRLASLAAELADDQHRLDLLDAGGDPRTAARAVFSWSLRHLDPAAAQAFRLLGLHPGPDLDSHAAAALTGTSPARTSRVLDQLTRAHLLQSAGQDRHSMHDMLRDYARELTALPDSHDDPRAALTRLLDHYLDAAREAMRVLYPDPQRPPAPPAADDAGAARAWLDAELANLVAVTAHAAAHGWPGHATQLAATLFLYLDTGGHYAEASAIYTQARTAAQQTGDQAAEAEALVNFGTAAWRQGQYETATSHLQHAVTLYREIGDKAGQARAIGNLGTVDLQRSRFHQAIGHHEQALALYRQLGNQAGQAAALGNIGIPAHVLGHYQQAADLAQEALGIYRQIGNRAGEAVALAHLGDARLRQSQYQQAARHLSQARALCRETGNRACEAHVLDSLGDLDRLLGRHEQANSHYLNALAIRRDIGDRSGEADSLNGLGQVYIATDRLAAARSTYEEALKLAIRLHLPHSQACAHEGLGSTYQATGDQAEARQHWQKALTLYGDLGLPEADRIRAKLGTAQARS
jgi:DNA-binding SARP family transcriptional activator/tetratricopeptide (TPR) repeat protein